MDGQGAADWGLNGVKKKIKRSKPAFFDVYGGWSKDARSLFPEVAPILTKGGHFFLHFPLNLGFFIEWDRRFFLLHQRPPWAGVPRPTRRLSSHLRLVEGGRKPKSVTETVEDWGMPASNHPVRYNGGRNLNYSGCVPTDRRQSASSILCIFVSLFLVWKNPTPPLVEGLGLSNDHDRY